MGDCPKCGLANPGAVDFCPNPQCRTYLGWAAAAEPPQSPVPPSPPQRRGVRVTVEPAELTVDPGGEVTTTVTVRNLGTRVEQFQLMPQGPGAAYASITPPTLSVYPDDEQPAVVRFAPLRSPQSPAGVAAFEVVAHSAIHADVSDVARGRLTITSFEDLSAVLQPEVSRGRKPARHQVSVTNGGNTPVNTQLTFRDQDGTLTFTPRDGAATLPPGATQHFPVRINGPRRWFGRTERLSFSAVVTPAGPQPPITLPGTRQQTAVFPWWIPTALLTAVAIAIALFAVLKPGASTVPPVAGRTQSVAEQELRNAGYVVDGATPTADPKPAGLVVGTDPAAGTPLDEGKRVQVFVSTGPCNPVCRVTVPATKGRTEAQARTLLGDAGFTVGQVVSAPSDLPAGTVRETSPAELTEAPTNVPVVLFTSAGAPLTPHPDQKPPPDQLGGVQSRSAAPTATDSPRTQQPVPPPPPPPPTRPAATPPPPTPSPPPPSRTCPPSSANQPPAGLAITSPGQGDLLREVNESSGTAHLASGEHLWLLLCAPGIHLFYFVSEEYREFPVSGDTWHGQVRLDPNEHGEYLLYAVVVNTEDNQIMVQNAERNGSPLSELPHSARYQNVAVRCCG
ncbi:MAG: PASTA domain-containing protein [Pseudonocardiaceae bacterium]